MKIRVYSDLHFEFHADGGKSFTDSLPTNDVDVLVLAGDICNCRGITKALTMLCRRFSKAQVLFTSGNHEYYGGDGQDGRYGIESVREPNFHWLNDRIVKVGDRSFIGGTLWFSEQHGPEWAMNDYFQIKDLRKWVYKANADTVKFLEKELQPDMVMITHHLPSSRCVHDQYTGSPINCYFVHDLTKLIEDRQPALVIHGHTHESNDFQIGNSRVLCNPMGYVGHATNLHFNPSLTVKL